MPSQILKEPGRLVYIDADGDRLVVDAEVCGSISFVIRGDQPPRAMAILINKKFKQELLDFLLTDASTKPSARKRA